jgi:hypothetical protein
MIAAARRDEGKVVVTGLPSRGPNANTSIMSVTPRQNLMDGVDELKKIGRGRLRSIRDSVAKAVAATTSRPLDGIDASAHENLMDDLVILMAAYMIQGPPALEGSGLMQLGLAIDPDETLPWERRGMLDPAVIEDLNLSVDPAVIYGGSGLGTKHRR